MYNQFFGLQKNPFNMTPDPSFLFLTSQHREALAGLTYAILEHKGFVVLTGEAGTGKSTLLAKALNLLPANRLQASVILNPALTPGEFLEMALLAWGIREFPDSKARRLCLLQDMLLKGHQQGKASALVVDEAHNLTPEVLEEIRMLGNFELSDQKLLQILLVGQSELHGLLDRQDLRQLKQRIALRLSIKPLAVPEVENYIRFRWTKAGAVQGPPFSPDALISIAEISRGIPRMINSVCDNALLLAFGEGSISVTQQHVLGAATDLCLTAAVLPPAEPVIAPPPQLSPPPLHLVRIGDLERNYNDTGSKRSRWARWAGKLGFVQKVETT